MATLTVTNEQLRLIQEALDFYSRVGIGQFDVIKDHPTFQKNVYDNCTPKREPIVGDRTPQGKILVIKDGKALIDGSVVDGLWNEAQEWKSLKDVKLSTNYEEYHSIRDEVDNKLVEARNLLYGDNELRRNGSWGIYNPKVDNSCIVAYDILQIIRHEFWKVNPDKSRITVDSSCYLKSKDSNQIKCELQ